MIDRERLAELLRQLDSWRAELAGVLGADTAANEDAELQQLASERAARMRRARGGR